MNKIQVVSALLKIIRRKGINKYDGWSKTGEEID